jgi:hypothetical protein
MRLQVLAPLSDLAEWRWLRAFMAPVAGELLRTLGYSYGQPYPPDVVELLAAIEVWPPG